MKFTTSLLVLLASASGFTTSPSFVSLRSSPSNSHLFTSVETSEATDTFYAALKWAEKSSIKSDDLKELDRLATFLEDVDGCNFEVESVDGGMFCEKEEQDRMDVAGILRLKIELALRLEYLKDANLFAADVRKEHDVQKRQAFKEELLANREKAGGGSDLGLW